MYCDFLIKRINDLTEAIIRKRKTILLSVVALQFIAFSYWTKDIVDNAWGSKQISILNASIQTHNGENMQLNEQQKVRFGECPYFKCDNELKALDELYGLSKTRDLNLTIEYHCRSLNENRVSKSRLVDGIAKIELNCYK